MPIVIVIVVQQFRVDQVLAEAADLMDLDLLASICGAGVPDHEILRTREAITLDVQQFCQVISA